MIVNLFVLVLLQMNAPFEIEGSDLPDSICSRIVATPSGKTEPMIFSVDKSDFVIGVTPLFGAAITINNDTCIMNETLIGKPCFNQTSYVNITINDATQFDTLITFGEEVCVATFAPNCLFKPVKPGNVIPELSFPFARYVKGNDSVTIHFSLNKSESSINSSLYMDNLTLCSWVGIGVGPSQNSSYCKDLIVNEDEGRLDYTLEYKRINSEEITKFAFGTETSLVGVTVYWTKGGESPDVVECQNVNPLTTTSSGCTIGFTFTVLFGIIQWIFK